MPADKIIAGVKFNLPDLSSINYIFVSVNTRTYLEQNRNAENETSTPGYTLLDAGFGGTFSVGAVPVTATINATNILNKVYISHLSLLKPLGINDMGRNISLSLNIPFNMN